MFSERIEVKVGSLIENVLAGCTVAEGKCSWITSRLKFHTARRRPTLNHIIGGMDAMKACT